MNMPTVPTVRLFQPAGDVGMFVSRVVVDHQMNVQIGGNMTFDQSQEAQELLVAVSRSTIGDDLPGGGVQRREQGGGPVPFVIVGHGTRPPRFERQ